MVATVGTIDANTERSAMNWSGTFARRTVARREQDVVGRLTLGLWLLLSPLLEVQTDERVRARLLETAIEREAPRM